MINFRRYINIWLQIKSLTYPKKKIFKRVKTLSQSLSPKQRKSQEDDN